MISGVLTGCGLLGIGGHKSSIPGKIVFSAPDKAGTDQIFTMNADGSDRKQLTHFPTDGGGGEPAWSPDGKQIVFVNYYATTLGPYLYVMNADGSNMHGLKKMPVESPTYLWGTDPAWSPDGSKIAYDVCLDCERGGGNYEIMTVEVAGGEYDSTQVHRLTNNPASDMYPTWSQDGSQIAFVSDRDYPNEYGTDIYIVNADGTNLQRLTHNGGAKLPVWNPDGKTIAFKSSRPTLGLYQANVQSEDVNKMKTGLVGNILIYPNSWSPDGSMLLMIARDLDLNNPKENTLYILYTRIDSVKKVATKPSFIEKADWFVPTRN